jgi:hypothetical protein
VPSCHFFALSADSGILFILFYPSDSWLPQFYPTKKGSGEMGKPIYITDPDGDEEYDGDEEDYYEDDLDDFYLHLLTT